MPRYFQLPLAAAVMLPFAVAHALCVQRPDPDVPPPVPPPTPPFGHTVAGAGMEEPSTEASGTAAIAVGSQLSGVVVRLHVRIGQRVKAGDLLFALDSQQAEADLKVRQATLVQAQAQFRRLELQPGPEEVPVSKAQVDAAAATARQLKDVCDRDRKMTGTLAVTEQDRVAHEQAYRTTEAQLAVAKASLALLEAGAWEPDKVIAAAAVDLARAQVEQAQTTLRLQRVPAPVDGTILQVNVRPGEHVSTSTASQSLILLVSLEPLHVRVNVDEEDLPATAREKCALCRQPPSRTLPKKKAEQPQQTTYSKTGGPTP
jgi:multidrug resistance efflux pump